MSYGKLTSCYSNCASNLMRFKFKLAFLLSFSVGRVHPNDCQFNFENFLAFSWKVLIKIFKGKCQKHKRFSKKITRRDFLIEKVPRKHDKFYNFP